MGWKDKVAESVWGAIKGSKKGLKSSGTEAITTVKPGVGGLKVSSKMKESLSEAAATGTKKFGRPHMTDLIAKQGIKKGFHGLIKDAGDLARSKKKLGTK